MYLNRYIIQVIATVLLLNVLPIANAQNDPFQACIGFFANGKSPRPLSPSNLPGSLRTLCYDGFAILHSGQTKTPVFVAEKLNRSSLQLAGRERTDNFYEEARLPINERALLSDYHNQYSMFSLNFLDKSIHYDRGHMSPAADQSSDNAMAQSFSLANMVPQAPKNNRGIWAKAIEKPTRQYAMRAQGDVFVITGPVYKNPVSTIGAGKVWVPHSLFKLVYDSRTQKAWVYWIENSDEARMQPPISYQELVSRTGIEFLPGSQVMN